MNNTLSTTPKKERLQPPELRCLFELKGYDCREIKNAKDTVYIFKASKQEHIDYNLYPNPNWKVVRSQNNSGIDWL